MTSVSTRILGVRIDPASREEAAGRIVLSAEERRFQAVHLCNAYVLELASREPDYAALLNRGDLNLADGAPVRWLLRRLGVRVGGARPSGTELFRAVMGRTRDGVVAHVLHGSTPEVVSAMRSSLEAAAPGVRIAVAESPPFRPLTDEEVDDLATRIEEAAPVVVWIGTGTPRQDELVDRLAGKVGAPVVPIGAAFDFVAGAKVRAPSWMRRFGLEWLHRLVTEPRRLWRRYLVDGPRFLLRALRATRR